MSTLTFFQFFQGCVQLIIYVSDQTTRSQKKGIKQFILCTYLHSFVYIVRIDDTYNVPHTLLQLVPAR